MQLLWQIDKRNKCRTPIRKLQYLVVAFEEAPETGQYATRKHLRTSENGPFATFTKLLQHAFPSHGMYEPYVLIMNTFASAINYTIVIGGKIAPHWTGKYADVYIKISAVHQSTGIESFPELTSFLLWDTYVVKLLYYEKDLRFKVANFFLILANPFDYRTWIMLTVTLCIIVSYIYRFNIGSRKLHKAMFEVVQLVFQKNVRVIDYLRIPALFGFFFTEFFLPNVTDGKIYFTSRTFSKKNVE